MERQFELDVDVCISLKPYPIVKLCDLLLVSKEKVLLPKLLKILQPLYVVPFDAYRIVFSGKFTVVATGPVKIIVVVIEFKFTIFTIVYDLVL